MNIYEILELCLEGYVKRKRKKKGLDFKNYAPMFVCLSVHLTVCTLIPVNIDKTIRGETSDSGFQNVSHEYSQNILKFMHVI